jgi:hypothetical protein
MFGWAWLDPALPVLITDPDPAHDEIAPIPPPVVAFEIPHFRVVVSTIILACAWLAI